MGISRKAAASATAAMLAAGLLATAAPARADYGNTAWRQVALSANINGRNGGGVWLWMELSGGATGGSVDYQGADCGHGGAGAVHDSGSAWWHLVNSGSEIEIDGVILNGLGGFPATVTVPTAIGHYTGTIGTFITLPSFIPAFLGTSQLQVAP